MVLAALSAGAIGLGAFALEDLDVAPSQEAGVTGLSSPPQSPGDSAQRVDSAAAGLSAGLAALSDFETVTPTPTRTALPTSTATPPPPTPTELPPTETAVPPTETAPPPPTETPLPPTETPLPPTATPVPPTATPEPPTPTPTLAIPEGVPLLGEYVPPTVTPEPPTPTRSPATATPRTTDGPIDPDGPVSAYATRYADSLEGNSMACGGAFDQDNGFIVAVSLQYDQVWACGTQLEICGTAGCMIGVRTDTCPGCPGADIDLSRAGLQDVCGNQDGCVVTIRQLD